MVRGTIIRSVLFVFINRIRGGCEYDKIRDTLLHRRRRKTPCTSYVGRHIACNNYKITDRRLVTKGHIKDLDSRQFDMCQKDMENL